MFKRFFCGLSSSFVFVVALVGCAGGTITDPFAIASGTQVNYVWTDGHFDISSNAKVSVGVIDRRDYVMSGNKPGQFAGLTREGFGIPHDVTTKSNNTLSDDFVVSIVSGLNKAGIQSEAVMLDGSDVNQAQESLKQHEGDRFILIVINEWKADTYHKTELVYNLDVYVLASNENEVVHKRFAGNEVRESPLLTPKGRHIETMEMLYPKKLKEIFRHDEIRASLAMND